VTALRQLADLLEDGADICDVPAPVLRRAADILRRAPDASVDEARAERDAAIVACIRKHYWDARSRRSGIISFLADIKVYELGRWHRRDQHSANCPDDIRGKRDEGFWRVLHPGQPLPDIRQIENILNRAARNSAK
jgi:hypothetical protein